MVKAEMGSSELETTLKGVAALFTVPPSTEDRAELSLATAASAKKAGVPHTLVVSVATTRATKGQRVRAGIQENGNGDQGFGNTAHISPYPAVR